MDRDNFQILFGKKIEQLRIEKALSYRQLAQRCSVDHSNISKIEKGEINIRLSTILELAIGLQKMPKELLDIDFDFEKYYKELDKI